MEIWKDIEGYEGLYQVSNEGRVKSVDRIIEIPNPKTKVLFKRVLNGKILKQYCKSDGYVIVSLGRHIKHQAVHRLVAKAFIPNPNGYEHIHHKNHNTLDNRVENLVWMDDSKHLAMHNVENKSRTVYQYTLDGKLVKIWPSTIEAARQLKYNFGAIAACCRNCYLREGNNVYKGFKWSYERL